VNRHQRQAVCIVNKIFELINFSAGETEKKIAVRLEAFLKGFDARPAFRTIVASGKRAAKPHGFATSKKIKKGDMVKIDFGALYKGWRSDITRTFFVGKPSSKQKKIYRIVLEAQRRSILVVKAGVECREVDKAAREYIKKMGFGKYFIHSTGHGVGRKIHEQPKLSFGNHCKLKAGQVITIEPGIYIKGWGGVRVEDMVLVTKKGAVLLTSVSRKLTCF